MSDETGEAREDARGAVIVELGGRTYEALPTFAAARLLQRSVGPLGAAAMRVEDLDVEVIVGTLHACIAAGCAAAVPQRAAPSIEWVGQHVLAAGLAQFVQPVSRLLTYFLGGASKAASAAAAVKATDELAAAEAAEAPEDAEGKDAATAR